MTVIAISSPGAPLPPMVDLGQDFQKFGLTPLQQGDRGDCSLFAITALAEFDLAKHSPVPISRLSEEFLIWAAHAASATKPGDQAMFYQAVHGLNTLGICTSELMPYARPGTLRHAPSPAARADALPRSGRWKVRWIKRWDAASGLRRFELAAIQQALAHGHPVACGLRWPKNLEGSEILRVPAPDEVADGHSIVFTGYRVEPGKPGGGVLLFRNSFGPRWGAHGYGVMSFAYALEFANDALWIELGAPGCEIPAIRFEAETLPILGHSDCDCGPQAMQDWGRGMWSQGAQLFCHARKGGSVRLAFRVQHAGVYRVRVLATAAPDYGRIRIALDGHGSDREFDLFCRRVSPAGSLEIGSHELAAGQHEIRITAEARNLASSGHSFGIDALDLLPP